MLNPVSKFTQKIPLVLVGMVALLLFGCSPAAEPGAARPASREALAAGNVAQGQALFMGYVDFENEGPPCMGCHSVGQNGLLGGGTMGPNLTNVSTRRSDDEIVGLMSNTGSFLSPVMRPIYSELPLTVEEQADLLAFMKASLGQPEADQELLVIGLSLLGFVAAVLLLGFVYRGRLRGVRRALVSKAQKELL